jgi:cytochrome c oxidase assembly factor CtaG
MGGTLALLLFVMAVCLSFSGKQQQGKRWPLRKSAAYLLILIVVAFAISAILSHLGS